MATKSTKNKPAPTPEEKRAKLAAAGVKARIKNKPEELAFKPNETERVVKTYITRRIDEMQDFRRSLNIEQRWREADEEYIPHELDFGTTRKRFETDQDTGLRSRMVPVGDITQQWRQASSAPTLLAKIQTAIGIIVDQQPEAELVAMGKKYQARTALVYAAWKRNWQVTNAKEKLKVSIFDLIKYGWCASRTFPRKVEYDKRILVETDPENPENDRYEEKKLLWFNDVDRQPLSVYNTWIDELAKPYDPYSVNEDYFELDMSFDAATVEFKKYPNWKYVKPDSQMVRANDKKTTNRSVPTTESLKRKDIVTVGFFESRHKDMLAIWIPKDGIIVYVGPTPNDDGMLSVIHTLWIMRRSGLPYGVSMWEIIRQNKTLYDKMKNMTMDQLVLSIMKFGFFSGTNTALGDGKMEIVPGQARQLTSSTGKPEVNWMEIPGPGQDSWKGLEAVAAMMDDESGISPALEGEITGKTLGEILHAKDASLKRLKVPVDNICWLIEQDAYLTISWMAQLYAVPQIMEFATEAELQAFEKEEEINHSGPIFGTVGTDEETKEPNVGGPFKAQYYPQLALHLEDSQGQLEEGKESKYFQMGENEGQIRPGMLKWRGIFKVLPRSIIDTSQDLIKAMKSEMFNMLVPLFQFPPELVAKAAKQIILVNEEDYADWLPDAWVQYLETPADEQPQKPQGPPPPGAAGAGAPSAPPAGQGAAAGNVAPPAGGTMPAPGGPSMQAQSGLTPPQAATIVPGTNMPSISQLTGGKAGAFGRRL